MKIVLAGGTGFIGRALREKLCGAGHEVIVLVRHTGGTGKDVRETSVEWEGAASGSWIEHFDGADAVINLAGEDITARKWKPSRKQKILSSRVDTTRAIVDAIGRARKKPQILINASAAGYYGDAADQELTETSRRGAGFLADVCEVWEAEAKKAERFGVRVILARLGPVLGEKGGMLSKMLPLFLFFAGAPLGTGRQWIPWIHQEDAAGVFLFMLERSDLSGPVNVTAPAPVTMSRFSSILAGALRRPAWFPVPPFVLKIFMGEMAWVVLASQKALPQKLLGAGYQFRHPDLAEALDTILRKSA